MTDTTKKPSFDVWWRWADVLGQRLDTVRQIYEDHDQREAAARVAMILTRIQHILGGEMERHLAAMPYAALQPVQGAERFDEIQIHGLAGIFSATLELLPVLSKDMQKLLTSPWQGQCNGRVASDLFKGPRGTFNEGIGSGLPLNGQLPQMLVNLLEQERTGTSRGPRQSTLSTEEQQKWIDTARRWATRNSVYMRRAGGVE